MCFSARANKSSAKTKKHRKPEQSEDPSRFSTEDYAAILFTKRVRFHTKNQLFFSTKKYVLSIFISFISISKHVIEDEGFSISKKITSNLAIFFQYNFINICQATKITTENILVHMVPFSIPKATIIWREFICQDNLAILIKTKFNLKSIKRRPICANQSSAIH